MLKVSVDQPSKAAVRVKIEGDEPEARLELLNMLRELFAPEGAQQQDTEFVAHYSSREAAAKAARTISAVWGGELVRCIGEGEPHIKKLLKDALDAWLDEHPNTSHINKISPIQLSFRDDGITGLMTVRDELAATGEYDYNKGHRHQHWVGEFIDSAWSWALDTEGRIA